MYKKHSGAEYRKQTKEHVENTKKNAKITQKMCFFATGVASYTAGDSRGVEQLLPLKNC